MTADLPTLGNPSTTPDDRPGPDRRADPPASFLPPNAPPLAPPPHHPAGPRAGGRRLMRAWRGAGEQARKLRAEFEANRHLDRVQGERLVAKGEERLAGTAHPDPYIVPYYTGGSLYARNPEVPADVKIHLDFGREGYDQS